MNVNNISYSSLPAQNIPMYFIYLFSLSSFFTIIPTIGISYATLPIFDEDNYDLWTIKMKLGKTINCHSIYDKS